LGNDDSFEDVREREVGYVTVGWEQRYFVEGSYGGHDVLVRDSMDKHEAT
jgi:hypothetical protein